GCTGAGLEAVLCRGYGKHPGQPWVKVGEFAAPECDLDPAHAPFWKKGPAPSPLPAPVYLFAPQIPYSVPHQRRVVDDQREVICLVATRRSTSSIARWKIPRSTKSSRSSMPS